MSSPTTGAGEVTPREPLVSVVVPSIGSTGTVHGHTRTFVVEAVRSVLATAGVAVEVVVVSGREMPPPRRDDARRRSAKAGRCAASATTPSSTSRRR